LGARAQQLLSEGGHSANDATLRRVAMTLSGLAAVGSFEPDAPGALSKDRDPPGFEAFGMAGASEEQDQAEPAAREQPAPRVAEHAAKHNGKTRSTRASEHQRQAEAAQHKREAEAEAAKRKRQAEAEAAERKREAEAQAKRQAQRKQLEGEVRDAKAELAEREHERDRVAKQLASAEREVERARESVAAAQTALETARDS